MKDQFPQDAKPGDQLSADWVSRVGRVLEQHSMGGSSAFAHGRHQQSLRADIPPAPWTQVLIKVTSTQSSGTSGVYQGEILGYLRDDALEREDWWIGDNRPYNIDASGYGKNEADEWIIELEIDSVYPCYWDVQRGTFIPICCPSGEPLLDQEGFQGFEDDAPPGSATPLESVNANWSQEDGKSFRVRFSVREYATHSLSNRTMLLNYRLNGGSWGIVSSTSDVVRVVETEHYISGDHTTQLISSGTFVGINNGLVEKTPQPLAQAGVTGESPDFAGSDVVEVEYALQLVGLTDNDEVELKMVRNSEHDLDRYSQVPTITVIELSSSSSGANESSSSSVSSSSSLSSSSSSSPSSESSSLNSSSSQSDSSSSECSSLNSSSSSVSSVSSQSSSSSHSSSSQSSSSSSSISSQSSSSSHSSSSQSSSSLSSSSSSESSKSSSSSVSSVSSSSSSSESSHSSSSSSSSSSHSSSSSSSSSSNSSSSSISSISSKSSSSSLPEASSQSSSDSSESSKSSSSSVSSHSSSSQSSSSSHSSSSQSSQSSSSSHSSSSQSSSSSHSSSSQSSQSSSSSHSSSSQSSSSSHSSSSQSSSSSHSSSSMSSTSSSSASSTSSSSQSSVSSTSSSSQSSVSSASSESSVSSTSSSSQSSGVGEITFESIFTAAHCGTNVASNLSPPSGTSEGDLLIAVVVTDGETVPIAPAGWTSALFENAVNEVTMRLWWKIATASEPPSYIFSWGSPIEDSYGAILRYTGTHQTTPLHKFLLTTGFDAAPLAPSVTTTVDGTKILRTYGMDLCKASFGPVDHDVRYNGCSCGNAVHQCTGKGADADQPSAGASGTAGLTIVGSTAWVAFTVAIRPPA